MREDGQLLVAFEPDGETLLLGVVEPRTGQLVTTFAVPSLREDVRALTWPLPQCGNPSPGGPASLITDVSLDREVVCTNEPVRVDVATRHPEGGANPVHVDVNTTYGESVVLQFGGGPGTRSVVVTASTFEGYIDSRVLTVEVVECAPDEVFPRVHVRPSPFHEHTVDFTVENAGVLGEAPRYLWDFGDGEVEETDVPHAEHGYNVLDLDRDAIVTVFEARVTVLAAGQPERTVSKTVSIGNAYGLAKRGGVVQPPVESGLRMVPVGDELVGTFEITNLEDESVTLAARRDELQSCDRDVDPEFEDPEEVSIVLAPRSARMVAIGRPIGELLCDLTVHFTGSTASGTLVRASAYFAVRDPERRRETDPVMLETLNRVAAEGLVDDPCLFADALRVNPSSLTNSTTKRCQCAGGEVVGKLTVTVTLLRNAEGELDGNVEVRAVAKLYEGASCGTEDLEDTQTMTFTLAPGELTVRHFSLENPPDFSGDGDLFDLDVTFVNEQDAGVDLLCET